MSGSSKKYDPNSPSQRLNDIAERFRLIREFIEGVSRADFLKDTLRQYAVVRALEEACEAALWFNKNENGKSIREKYPDVSFRRFGDAGNLFRHQYNVVDYEVIWDKILKGKDVAAMESLLETEVPFYKRHLSKELEVVNPAKVARRVSVKSLCESAGYEYVAENDENRIVTFVKGGGHRVVPVLTRKDPELCIDLDALPDNLAKLEGTLEVLTILATELRCKEAGDTLTALKLLEALPNGEYRRRPENRSGGR